MKKTVFFLMVAILSLNVFSAEIMLKGIVKNLEGETLPGATVTIKGSTTGVASDASGVFAIKINTETDKILCISFVGYSPQELDLNCKSLSLLASNSLITVFMESANNVIPEVLVVGGKRRINVAGASKVFYSQDFEKYYDIFRALESLVPNFTMSRDEKTKEDDYFINRGTTFNRYKLTFYLDGWAVSASMLNKILNTQDIETVAILQGGIAGARYGASAIGGAVVITTKN